MSVALAVIQPNPLQQCRRCGDCCKNVCIPFSPRQLQERFSKDMPYIHERGTERRDIRIVYPMLSGRCIGKLDEKPPHRRYVYSCRNLSFDETGLAVCSLHGKPEKPYMCSGYPFYDGYVPLNERNPGYVKGCGYNLDREAGGDFSTIDECLLPLDESELEISLPVEVCT